MRLDGRTVLVTGASEGIGAACVEAFRRRGCRLALLARSEDKLRAIASDADIVLAGDLRDPDFRASSVGRTIDRFGAVDILVNNAGVGLYVPAHKAPMPAVRQLFELNLLAPLDLI